LVFVSYWFVLVTVRVRVSDELADHVITIRNNNVFGGGVELAALCGSNTAVYHLGARKGSVTAMFYMVKFILKESGTLPSSLAVMTGACRDNEAAELLFATSASVENFAELVLTDLELNGTLSHL